MELFAYIGEEEFSDREPRVGLKQGVTAAGNIPLVVMGFDRHKIDNAALRRQLQTQANTFGKTIRLGRFVFVEAVVVIEPQPNLPTVHVLGQGRALCGFHAGPPSEWPEGHLWVGTTDDPQVKLPKEYAACEACNSLLRAAISEAGL